MPGSNDKTSRKIIIATQVENSAITKMYGTLPHFFNDENGNAFEIIEENNCDEIKQSKKELLNCIQNLMAIVDTPIGRRRNPDDFATEVRKIATDILNSNNIKTTAY